MTDSTLDEHVYTRLKVSKTHGVKVCLLDKEGADLYDTYTWSIFRTGRSFYLVRVITVDGKSKTKLFHRELLGLKDGEIRDHIDGNGLNNMKSNLRPTTVSQNAHNTRTPSNNTSGIKGMTFRECEQLWRGQIMCDGIRYEKSSKDQQLVIDWLYAKRIELHGVFANSG